MVYSGDSIGLIVNPSRSSFQVFSDSTQINYEHLEDYGNPLQKCTNMRLRDLIDLKASITVFPETLLRAEENSLYLREIPTLEDFDRIVDSQSFLLQYVRDQSIPSDYLKFTYQDTQHWVSQRFEYLKTRIPGLIVEVLKLSLIHI